MASTGFCLNVQNETLLEVHLYLCWFVCFLEENTKHS